MSGENMKTIRKRIVYFFRSKNTHFRSSVKRRERITHCKNPYRYLNKAIVHTIKKSEKEIRSAVVAGSSKSAKISARPSVIIIQKMERAFNIWFDDSCQKNIPLDSNIIRQKALQIYNHLKQNEQSSVNLSSQ